MSNILDPIIMFILFGFLLVSCVFIMQLFESLTNGTGLIPDSYRVDGERFYVSLDNMGLFIVIAIMAITIGSAYLIKSNPIFFVIAVLLLFTQWVALPIVVNTFNSILANPSLSTGVSFFEKTIWLLGLSPVLSILGGGIAAVVGLRGE